MRLNSLFVLGFCLTVPLTASSILDPVYSNLFGDATTGNRSFVAADGKTYWDIAPGADVYQQDQYERPTGQTYEVRSLSGGQDPRFGTDKYYANLDIMKAKFGYDDTYLYVSIEMYGTYFGTSDGNLTSEELKYSYGFRIGSGSPVEPAGGYLFRIDNPANKLDPNVFNGDKASAYFDTNGDVGGSGITTTKQDNLGEVSGNGYDRQVVQDGRYTGAPSGSSYLDQLILFSRIGATPSIVEFAVNYVALGIDPASLAYLVFESDKGNQSPQNYLWNDEYNHSEAGSPYRATSGDLTKSEFGTQGLGNIYELDTLRAGPGTLIPPDEIVVPEPGSMALMCAGMVGLLAWRRRHSSSSTRN